LLRLVESSRLRDLSLLLQVFERIQEKLVIPRSLTEHYIGDIDLSTFDIDDGSGRSSALNGVRSKANLIEFIRRALKHGVVLVH